MLRVGFLLLILLSCEDTSTSNMELTPQIATKVLHKITPYDGFDQNYSVGDAVEISANYLKITELIEPSRVLWTSNIDGIISEDEILKSADLSRGEHIVEVVATFEDNSTYVFSDTLKIVNRSENSSLYIKKPNAWGFYFEGDSLVLDARALSLTGSELNISAVSWESDIDGIIGNQLVGKASPLSIGTHNVSLTVTYSDGSKLSSSIDVEIKNFRRVRKVEGSSFFITTNNELWGIGDNSSGMLGLAKQIFEHRPKYIASGVQNIKVYGQRSILTDENGNIKVAGNNYFGVFGDGTRTGRTQFQSLSESNIRMFSIGFYQSFLVKNDNTLWVSGNEAVGDTVLGAVVTQKNTFFKVDSNVSRAFGGDRNSAIIKLDNSLWMAGYNYNGQLGDNSTTDRKNYVHVMDNVKSVSLSSRHTMIIDNDNNLWATGSNSLGEFGNGTYNGSTTPVYIMSNVKEVLVVYGRTAVLKEDNSLWMFGRNSNGEFGNGTTISSNVPVKVFDDVISFSIGYAISYAVKSDNTLWVWGERSVGAGDQVHPYRYHHRPTQIKF